MALWNEKAHAGAGAPEGTADARIARLSRAAVGDLGPGADQAPSAAQATRH